VDNVDFLDLLQEATDKDEIYWTMLTVSPFCYVPQTGILDAFYTSVDGYHLKIFPVKILRHDTDGGKDKIVIALGLDVREDRTAKVRRMTSDPDIIDGEPEPGRNYLLQIYLCAMRNRTKYIFPIKYETDYPLINATDRTFVPKGWNISDLFSSKPASMEQ